MKAILAPGQKFMDIDLMADIPNKFLYGRVENIMERNCQLDHAQVGTKVTSAFGKSSDEFIADLLGELMQLFEIQLFDVHRAIYHLQVSAHIPGFFRFRFLSSRFGVEPPGAFPLVGYRPAIYSSSD